MNIVTVDGILVYLSILSVCVLSVCIYVPNFLLTEIYIFFCSNQIKACQKYIIISVN